MNLHDYEAQDIMSNRLAPRTVLRFSVLATCLALLGLGATGSTNLQEGPPPAAPAAATVVKTGIYLLNVGRLDTTTGNFTADFYLTFDCDRPCNPARFEFANGQAVEADLQYETPTRREYRIQGNFSTNIDFRSYPFDKHKLLVALEDKQQPEEELVYQFAPELTGVDSEVIVSGWELMGWEARVTSHYYPVFDETYSRFEFFIEIRRGTVAAVLKALLPALFIVAGGFLAFLLGPDKALHRLTIDTGALTGAILFHVNVTSQIPPVGSLTYADKFMIVNYIGLVGALLTTVFMLILTDQKRDELAERIHRITRSAVPLTWLLLQAVAAYTL